MSSHNARASRGNLVMGVIGSDVHIIGLRLLEIAFREAGYQVTSLGICVPLAEFVEAAMETSADAILVSSVYGHAEIDCRGLRAACTEAGLPEIALFVGGNLVVGARSWPEVAGLFEGMGFDRAFPPGLRPKDAVAGVEKELARLRQARGYDMTPWEASCS
jgi:methylaspartate mutase sigma subunit